MTKLMEWATAVAVYFSIWYSCIYYKGYSIDVNDWRTAVTLSPILIFGLFGVYSVVVILSRVYSFNDCPEAAIELQKQIIEAKEDLKRKGLKL